MSHACCITSIGCSRTPFVCCSHSKRAWLPSASLDDEAVVDGRNEVSLGGFMDTGPRCSTGELMDATTIPHSVHMAPATDDFVSRCKQNAGVTFSEHCSGVIVASGSIRLAALAKGVRSKFWGVSYNGAARNIC